MSEHIKHLVVYLYGINKNSTDIYRKLSGHFPNAKISYSTITDWLGSLKEETIFLIGKLVVDELQTFILMKEF